MHLHLRKEEGSAVCRGKPSELATAVKTTGNRRTRTGRYGMGFTDPVSMHNVYISRHTRFSNCNIRDSVIIMSSLRMNFIRKLRSRLIL